MRCFLTGLMLGLLGLMNIGVSAGAAAPSEYHVADTLEIDRVPSWFPVGFCLLHRARINTQPITTRSTR